MRNATATHIYYIAAFGVSIYLKKMLSTKLHLIFSINLFNLKTKIIFIKKKK